MSPRTAAWLHQIGVGGLFGVFVFEKYLKTPEQRAVLHCPPFFSSHQIHLVTLLPLSPWVDATLVRTSKRRCQCQAGSPRILNLREDHGRVRHTSAVTTRWGRSSPSPGQGLLSLIACCHWGEAHLFGVGRFFNSFHRV